MSALSQDQRSGQIHRPGPLYLPLTICVYFFSVLSSVFIVAGSIALILAGAFWVRLQRSMRLTQKVDYPGLMRAQAFDSVPGDRTLAYSAQMFHYQQQKQAMMRKHRKDPKVPGSGAWTDEENDEGDFTVYECPGLAPTGEMEVKNPLFDDFVFQVDLQVFGEFKRCDLHQHREEEQELL